MFRRRGEERRQALDEPVAAALEVPRYELARDRRRLHRHVVDVVAAQQGEGALQAAVGLVVAEDGLPEQVEVEPEPLLPGRREAPVQPTSTREDDQVRDELP